MFKISKKLIISLTLILLIIATLIGFVAYQFLILPNIVASDVNANLAIVNNVNSRSVGTLDSLAKKFEIEPKNLTEYKEYIKTIQENRKALNDVIIENKNNSNEIKDGYNSDTKDFAEASRNLIKSENELISQINKDMESSVCLINSLYDISNNLSKTQSTFAETDLTSKNSAVTLRLMSEETTQTSQSISQMENCFNADNKSLYTTNLSKTIDADKKQLAQFRINLIELAVALERNDIKTQTEKTKELSNFIGYSPMFLSDKDFTSSLSQPSTKIKSTEAELVKNFELFEASYNKIKQKYNLQ